MWKLSNLISVTGLVFAVVAGISRETAHGYSPAPPDRTISVESPNRRYLVRFSAERSENDAAGKLWGAITIRDVRDAEQAIVLFQSYWEPIVLAEMRDESPKKILARTMTERVQTRKKLSARLASSREVYDRVNSTLSLSERKTLILYGALVDIDRAGECWVIESFTGCPCSEVAGYLDAKTGQLMFVWIMPEG